MTDSRILIRMSDSCLAACHEFCHQRVWAGDSCPAGWLGHREIRAGPLEEHGCKVWGGNRSAAGGLHAAEHCHPAAGWAYFMLAAEPFWSVLRISPDRNLSFSGVCWVAAAVCNFAAGMRQLERWKISSFRKTAAPRGWIQQVGVGFRYTHVILHWQTAHYVQWLNLPQLCFFLLKKWIHANHILPLTNSVFEMLCSQRVNLQLRLYVCLPVCSTKEHSQVLTSSLESLEKREGVLQDKLSSLKNQHVQDASRLRMQLDQAHAHTHTLQKEVYTFSPFRIRLNKGKYSFNFILPAYGLYIDDTIFDFFFPVQGCNATKCE